ncbi:MAG: efflux RND transporter periplasmic adaptor subunit [Aquabacterium sp.]|nr:efflux RND transporter periplasmic adaptor subunit [Aquabacterium sp.]
MKDVDVNFLTAMAASIGCVLATLNLSAHAAAPRGFDCLIEPNQVVEIRSPVEGLIEKINVNRGDTTRKGQVLFELNSGVERSNVALTKHRSEMIGRLTSARDRLAFATKKLDRTVELLAEHFISEQARDEALIEKRLAQSDLTDMLESQEQARLEHLHAVERLDQRSVRSPFDGLVMERLLNVGELAEAGSGRKPVLKLAQINPLRVEVVLPQSAYGRVTVGTKVGLTADGFSGNYQARVTVVDKVIDAASGMFGVRLELANPKGFLPGGIHCAVAFPGLQPTAEAQGTRLR